MINLNITVKNKIATYLQRDGVIVCGNSGDKNGYQITFTFDEEWDAYPTKTARFIWNGKYWDQPFSGNVCPVPKITNAVFVLVGVYVGDLSTTTPASIPCKRSILCDDVEINDVNIEACREQAVDAAYRAEASAAIAEAANPETQRAELEAYVVAEVADELAKRGQLKPEFANSIEELEESGDISKLYVLPDNLIYAFMKSTSIGEVEYTNLVTDSTDENGNRYNDLGYCDGVRLSSSGSISSEAQAGSVTTGFMEFKPGCTLRFKGATFLDVTTGHHYLVFYDGNKTKKQSLRPDEVTGNEGHIITSCSYDETTGITTITFDASATSEFGTNINASSLMRMTLKGSGADLIVTVNAEIKEATATDVERWTNTGHAFVPADCEDRVLALEKKSEQIDENTRNISQLEEHVTNILDGNTEISASTKFDATVYDYLPVLYLTGDISPIFASKDNEVTLDYTYGERTGTCKLKGQGSSSYKMAKAFIEAGKAGKFNYTIKFDTAFEASEGWGAQKKYCLKANWIDHTHARNIISAKLWGKIVKSRTVANATLNALPNGGAIDGFPIVIVLNNEFHGLYTLNIPKDGWMLGLEEDSTKTQAIMSAHQHSDATGFKGELIGDESDFELEFASDENNTDWVTTSLNRLINACIASDGTDLDTTLANYLDWDSAIDYFIHVVVLRGEDMVTKNFLLVTLDGTKWFFTAYDMDSTFGLAWDASKLSRPVSEYNFVGCAEKNRVFELIKKYKKDALRARYTELRADILSESRMAQTFENFAWNIPSPVLAEDVKKYPTIRGSSVNGIDQICRWIRQRLETCDKWINSL